VSGPTAPDGESGATPAGRGEPTPPAPAERDNLDAEIARDHLANERTFLAWTRTGIAMLGFGVLIVRFRFETGPSGAPSARLIHAADLGLLFAGSGVLVVLASIWRYAAVRRMLRERRFESSVVGPVLFGAGICLLGVVILFYLLERLPFGLP
jgi:inner membrane protein YidH